MAQLKIQSETNPEVADDQAESKSFLGKIGDRLRGKNERAVQLKDGRTVTPEMAAFLAGHPDAEFLGTDVQTLALEQNGRMEGLVRWNLQKHTRSQRRIVVREFARVEGVTPTPAGVPALPMPQIWMCRAGNMLHIGRTLAAHVLARITMKESEVIP